MEKETIEQVIEEAKQIKFANPITKKSWKTSIAKFVVDDNYNVNWFIKYTTWANLSVNLKNPYLQNMFVVSSWSSTWDEIFKKKYFR